MDQHSNFTLPTILQSQESYIQSLEVTRIRRRPIFRAVTPRSQYISMRNSMTISQLQGDDFCPEDEGERLAEISEKPEHNQKERKSWMNDSSSDEECIITYKKPVVNKMLVNYSSVNVPSPKMLFSDAPTPIIKQKQTQNISEYRSVAPTPPNITSMKQNIELQRLQLQNQMLKSQQHLLTLIIISNQNKLKSLQQMQNIQNLNADYQRKIYKARKTVEGWKSMNLNRKVLHQLMSVLSY